MQEEQLQQVVCLYLASIPRCDRLAVQEPLCIFTITIIGLVVFLICIIVISIVDFVSTNFIVVFIFSWDLGVSGGTAAAVGVPLPCLYPPL